MVALADWQIDGLTTCSQIYENLHAPVPASLPRGPLALGSPRCPAAPPSMAQPPSASPSEPPSELPTSPPSVLAPGGSASRPDSDGGGAFDSSLHVALITGAISVGVMLLCLAVYFAVVWKKDAERLHEGNGSGARGRKTADRVRRTKRGLKAAQSMGTPGVEGKEEEQGVGEAKAEDA